MAARHQLEFDPGPGIWLTTTLTELQTAGKYPYNVDQVDPFIELITALRRTAKPPSQDVEAALAFVMSLLDISTVSNVVGLRLKDLWLEDQAMLEAFLDPNIYDGSITFNNVYDFFTNLRLGRQEGRAEAWLHNCKVVKEKYGGRFSNLVKGDQASGIVPALFAPSILERIRSAPASIRSKLTLLRRETRIIQEELSEAKAALARLQKGKDLFSGNGKRQAKKDQREVKELEAEIAKLLQRRNDLKDQISRVQADYFMGYGIKNGRMAIIRLGMLYPITGFPEMGPPVDYHGVRICTGNGLLRVDGERMQPGTILNKDLVVKLLTKGLGGICVDRQFDPRRLNHLLWFWGRGACMLRYCTVCPLRMRNGNGFGCIGRMSASYYYSKGQVTLDLFQDTGQSILAPSLSDQEEYWDEGGDLLVAESEVEVASP